MAAVYRIVCSYRAKPYLRGVTEPLHLTIEAYRIRRPLRPFHNGKILYKIFPTQLNLLRTKLHPRLRCASFTVNCLSSGCPDSCPQRLPMLPAIFDHYSRRFWSAANSSCWRLSSSTSSICATRTSLPGKRTKVHCTEPTSTAPSGRRGQRHSTTAQALRCGLYRAGTPLRNPRSTQRTSLSCTRSRPRRLQRDAPGSGGGGLGDGPLRCRRWTNGVHRRSVRVDGNWRRDGSRKDAGSVPGGSE